MIDINIILNQLDWCEETENKNSIERIDDEKGVIFKDDFWQIVEIPEEYRSKTFKLKEVCIIKRTTVYKELVKLTKELNPLGQCDWRIPTMAELNKLYEWNDELIINDKLYKSSYFSSDIDETIHNQHYVKSFYNGSERLQYDSLFCDIMIVR